MANRRDWKMTPKQEKIYENLWQQTQKILSYKHHHQAYRGTARYQEGVRNFCKHLAINYQSQNFRNISNKHLESFIKSSKEAGIKPGSLKTDLAAIRKLHSLIPNTKYKLETNNAKFGIEKRITRGVDRAWRPQEVHKAIATAKEMGRVDVARAIKIAANIGTRIEEVTALTKSQLSEALRTGTLSLTITKGGIPRDVPINQETLEVFREILGDRSIQSERVFTYHGRTHTQAIKSITNWIANHRDSFKDPYIVDHKEKEYQIKLNIQETRKSLTFHGIRHAYARNQYENGLKAGLNEKEARQEVATLLGHGRDEVTRIYLNQ